MFLTEFSKIFEAEPRSIEIPTSLVIPYRLTDKEEKDIIHAFQKCRARSTGAQRRRGRSSLRDPVRMGEEQSIDKTNLIAKEQAEAKA